MQAEDPGILVAAFAIAQFWLAPLLALGTSAVYFITSPATQTLTRKVGASAHGASIAALYIGALTFSAVGSAKPSYGIPFIALLLVPAALILLSLIWYEGRRPIHALQLVNVLCLVWTFFLGSMAITGNWL